MPKLKSHLFPGWAVYLFIILGAALIPWTIYLSLTLPAYHITSHWDVSWAGLDIGLLVVSLLTGIFAYTQSHWFVISASVLGSLLIVDAWFDVLDERRGLQLKEAILLAIFVEIPLAILCFFLAGRALKANT